MVFQIGKRLAFPDPHLAEPDEGLLAIGGDLSMERLLLAYSNGIFPWYSFRDADEPLWYCPQQRFVIFPKEIHVSHSMRTLLNKGRYKVTFGQAFDQVIHHCAQLREHEHGAWLGKDMIEAYTRLFRNNYAMSVEVWDTAHDNSLAGGLYGVIMGRAFFGESMFSLVPSGSKVALISLARRLAQFEGTLIDCQFETPHLKSMGGRYIGYDEYMDIIAHP